jgi:excisionase family DNA binding protein
MRELVSDPFAQYKDVHSAAERLKIHPESVKRLIRLGKLPARKFANKWFIHEDRLEQFARHYIPRPGNRSRLNVTSIKSSS